MTDILFSNFFGTCNDFESLKKWFRINSDLYRDVIAVAKERCDLEVEYSSKLSKINAKLLKSFSQSLGSVSVLWSKTAHFMNEESEAHKNLGTQIYEEMYKPLVQVSDHFNKFKKPIEADIDKCIKAYQDKREEEFRIKKRAFLSTKESEKGYEAINVYKTTHPTSVPGNDKERSKIEKRAVQLRDVSTRAETEYFDSSLASEECRHKWEQSFVPGLDQLQKLETDRLTSMKNILESYQTCVSKIPVIYADISSRLLKEIGGVNIRDDLYENCMNFTNKNPNAYKSEQLMLDFYAESKENPMDLGRRRETLMKRINVLYQAQKKFDNLRTGALKMLTVYEDSPQYADEATRKKTKREYSKTQSVVNLLSANIYKLQKSLNSFEDKPEPPNPLFSLGMKIQVVTDRNGLLQSILESKLGTMLPFFEPEISSLSSSNSGSMSKGLSTLDDDEDFDDDSDTEVNNNPIPTNARRPVVTMVSHSSSNSSSKSRPPSQIVPTSYSNQSRPLPSIPSGTRCTALHNFTGRDKEELSFNEGDIIFVKNKLNDVWWEGELRGKIGLIPANYVKQL